MPTKDLRAPTPPMGWNSWDCYGASVCEDALLANAGRMAQCLAPHGYRYVVCDIQWAEPTASSTQYHPFAPLCMDAYGRLMPAENRFPSARGGAGFGPIAARIHEMGLRFGIHIMRGIPRQAVHAGTPVLHSAATARDIAHPNSLCKWNTDMYGVNARAEGAQAYYDSLFALYASWGVDFVKVDDICNTNAYPGNPYSAAREIELIRTAMDRCGRDMVLSLSPGPAPIEHAWHLAQHANMWRITDDLWDEWPLVRAMFERCEVWAPHVRPGCWPDCDMLPLGMLRMFNGGEPSRLTRDEQVTLLTLWCIFRSPLMLGGDLCHTDGDTLALLTNADVLRVHRDGCGARQISRDACHAVWQSEDAQDGSLAVALFNLSDEARAVSVPIDAFAPAGQYAVYDCWRRAPDGTAGHVLSRMLPPHGAALLRLT